MSSSELHASLTHQKHIQYSHNYYYYYYTCLTASFPGQPGYNQSGFKCGKGAEIMRFWDTVASAGRYANNMHLSPDRQPHQHLITQFFTDRMLFLMPNHCVKALKVNPIGLVL